MVESETKMVAAAVENRKTAEELAREQREISVSEFFEKNRHLLGYDNKLKALLMIVKEGVDNSLDACEEARILPEIYVKVEEIEKEKFKIIIRDNGPGIVKKHIPKIFGTLLYGSKFHRLRQSRGAQGLGISCAVLYSQLTTGEPVEIFSSTGDGIVHRYKMKIDVTKNQPEVLEEESFKKDGWHGVEIRFLAEGSYREHKQGVLEYIKQTAIANPYAHIIFDGPTGRFEFPRVIDRLPVEPKAIKPHLEGIEIGILARMLKATTARTIQSFFVTEFTRVGTTTAAEICRKANIDPKTSPRRITDAQLKDIMEAIKGVRLISPPTDVLSPLGQELIESGLKKELSPEWVAAVTRPPAVYRGWPFQVEVGLAYGGAIQEPVILRFANRVPLLYKQGDCAITKAIEEVEWRRYGIPATKMPEAPLAIFVHMCSVWVPFTSESKEAIASYPVIIREIKLGLQEAGRKLGLYLSGKRKAEYQAERIRTFERYAGETAKALSELTKKSEKEIFGQIINLIKSKGEEIAYEEPE
jgi:DNA topoisomerase-6 subunit B